MDVSKEKGSSSWLSVLPLEDNGFYLHKGEFMDALCLRYGWKPNNTLQTCNYGAQITLEHAMIYHKGGFLTTRHEIHDVTAFFLPDACNSVTTEPSQQPLRGKNMIARSANIDDETRVEICARGF